MVYSGINSAMVGSCAPSRGWRIGQGRWYVKGIPLLFPEGYHCNSEFAVWDELYCDELKNHLSLLIMHMPKRRAAKYNADLQTFVGSRLRNFITKGVQARHICTSTRPAYLCTPTAYHNLRFFLEVHDCDRVAKLYNFGILFSFFIKPSQIVLQLLWSIVGSKVALVLGGSSSLVILVIVSLLSRVSLL